MFDRRKRVQYASWTTPLQPSHPLTRPGVAASKRPRGLDLFKIGKTLTLLLPSFQRLFRHDRGSLVIVRRYHGGACHRADDVRRRCGFADPEKEDSDDFPRRD